MERINWQEAYKSGKCSVKPDAFMLAEGGKVVITNCKKDGDKNGDPQIDREIIYDREYVINKLSKDTLLLILGLSKADYLTLFEQIWSTKHHKLNG